MSDSYSKKVYEDHIKYLSNVCNKKLDSLKIAKDECLLNSKLLPSFDWNKPKEVIKIYEDYAKRPDSIRTLKLSDLENKSSRTLDE